ncbi:MAG TPA: rhomboid family intramembrane serine protease [Bacteroidia bacterium]|jgi:membrane associated rhomboid family serine protease|nr:rhomboid family intramembrane serine protease [Bacteroidia bacterium]
MIDLRKHLILLKGLFPFTFVAIIWLVQLAQGFLQQDWSNYSVHPRHVDGLIGILIAPLLHAGWAHLLGNTIPLIVLGLLLFASYKEIAGKVFWLIYFLHSVLVWCFARNGYHLGASGIIYGIASFLFFSGLVRRNPPLTVISFLVVFIYGYMAHGIFPFFPEISWEAHLYGALTGLVFAVVLRKEGPQPRKYFVDEEEKEDHLRVIHSSLAEETQSTQETEATEETQPTQETDQPFDQLFPPPVKIHYEWKEKKKDGEEGE